MFMDSVKITVKPGNGGDGAIGFHREKYVPRGGPNGGDGGKGGDIVFRADEGANTLIDFRYTRKFKAQNGAKGEAGNKTGASAPALIIDVPVGTVIKDAKTGNVLLDMFEPGQERVLCQGARGGKGNARFATPTRQSPRFATPGKRTEEIEIVLELKTIADVGLIGMPNVGKSTILSVLTAAKPKIANYHFTTLSPNLGVVTQDESSFVLADIPGLIEGASEGAGLGHHFLRHIERTRLLLHVVDASGIEGRDPIEDFDTINAELSQYSKKLAALPQIIVANKTDLPDAEENIERLRKHVEGKNVQIFGVSAVTVSGFNPLLRLVVKTLADLPPVHRFIEEGFVPEEIERFTVLLEDDAYIVEGPFIDSLLWKTNAQDEDSLRHFQQMLQKEGVIDALRAKGAQEGDTVILGEWEFDFVD